MVDLKMSNFTILRRIQERTAPFYLLQVIMEIIFKKAANFVLCFFCFQTLGKAKSLHTEDLTLLTDFASQKNNKMDGTINENLSIVTSTRHKTFENWKRILAEGIF